MNSGNLPELVFAAVAALVFSVLKGITLGKG
jgi:hypothetical protein